MNVAATARRSDRQDELGQFLTPAPVADFMASMFGAFPNAIRLLDAGAGAGALTAAVVARVCQKKEKIDVVEATLFEIDSLIQKSLSATMRDCERRCAAAGIQFTFTIHAVDFIDEISSQLIGVLFGASPPTFNAAIANPPYRKIGVESAERRALRSVGIETSNLYTGFVALIQRLLVPGGELVAITPRSFCNGPYFRPFRQEFLRDMALEKIHVFESRRAAFRGDSVLQENIIFHGVKGKKQPRAVVISSSSGERGGIISENALPFVEVVRANDEEKFIHVPSTPSHGTAKVAMDGLGTNLESLGLSVSTGRVVDFRLKNAVRTASAPGTVPLLYPCHFNGGTIQWPKVGGRKPNAILDNDETHQLLVPSGVYLLTKRFTSKEERRRVVACIFDPAKVNAEWIGFENHLNYFHASGRGLERDLAVGLYLFLNSTIVDQYFRRFSGHTQVNATDLRALKYPTGDVLKTMGSEAGSLDLPQEKIDALVGKHLDAYR
jgi:adenine-specific DNA-methyltransferase